MSVLSGANLNSANLTGTIWTNVISQSDYNAVVAQRDARPTQNDYNAVVAQRDARLTLDEVTDLRAGSTMIEVHNGTPKNNNPRDEEFDMLSIDEERPSTAHTRLSCQTIVGESPLIITIRKPFSF